MDTESSGRLGDKDEDIDVDHYFLPGGILDTHHEEDMIGGSLLDEIGGAGNVKAVRLIIQPPTPLARVVVGRLLLISLSICLSIPMAKPLLPVSVAPGPPPCETDRREQDSRVGPAHRRFNSS